MTFVLPQPPAVQASVRMAMEVEREREQERLRRERANLERQSRTLAKLPTRKERAEIEAMEAVVEQSRKEAKAKDSRHKLTVERLRRQIVSLQVMRHDITRFTFWRSLFVGNVGMLLITGGFTAAQCF
jgi:hypothetical protein